MTLTSKKWLCSLGLHKWIRRGGAFAFARAWHHEHCSRCGKERYV